jgi:hypothetical protein
MSKIRSTNSAIIAEMSQSYSEGKIEVPLAKGVDLEALIEGDANPTFVTIDALADTVSGNKRRWTTRELHNVARQVMESKPDAYQGHLKPDERSNKAPDSKTLWLGAKVANHKGKNRLFIKGYILPEESKFRDYIKRAKAVGKNLAVSVYGSAVEKWNESVGAFDISNFKLESIDWARPGSEGVPNSGYLTVTSEMDGGDEMTKEEALKQSTISEMQEHNPAVVQEIETQAQAEFKKTISEMTEALGLEDDKDLPKTVSEMKAQNEELQTQVAHSEIDKILGNKVPNVAARQALRKMTIGEMGDKTDLKVVQESVDKVLESEEGKAITSAFKTPVLTPGGSDNREQPSGSRYIKK